MGEANRIIQLFQERASNELSVSSSLTLVQEEEELANQLFDVQALRIIKKTKQLWITIHQTMKQMNARKILMNHLMIQIMKKKTRRHRCSNHFLCHTRNERLITMMQLILKLENDHTRGKACNANLSELLIDHI
jgi:hypothetical protein